MCNWIIAVFTSAFSWGIADTIFDVILPSEDELPSQQQNQNNKILNQQHLTHSQTMLLCAFTTFIIIISYLIFIEYSSYQYLILNTSRQLSLSQMTLLLFSGILSYYHYHFIIKAFQNSSSTIILPFLQFSSVFAFLFSILQNYLSNRPYLSTKLHLIAYFLILLGGLAPATEGHLGKIFQSTFWKQPFVKYAIISDMSHAVYTNIVSYVGTEDNGMQFNIYANMEFFILTRIMFCVLFLIQLYFNKLIQREFIEIFTKSKSLILGTIFGEIMTLIGYFCSVYAYQCYYQAGVISASESSLNLIVNLFLAYILKKYYNIGKSGSLKNMGLKLLACITISIGLSIASL